ncbi:hypothetical protein V496_05077 [Pseudogymnoascus sp. VKM F-4515 (FW-2607)]|nr:hypothetical protein V496_05077 [Pseudogymnoascus sp. VKM F-4515 (FW-2607)]
MLHTASLLVDDVEDSSLLRRGLPVAHSIFGTAQTINSANYVYFLALQELFKLDELRDKEGGNGKPRGEAVRIYSEELINLHRGQGMDLYWRDTLTVPTEADYLEMVRNKTGGLFRLAVRLMQAESASTTDFAPLASLIGTLYQIRDDYANLLSPTYSTNKGLCEDLTEGKFSFPIIHAIRADPSLVLLNILRQKSADEEVKRYAVAYMEGKGSFAYCREVLKELGREAQAEVERCTVVSACLQLSTLLLLVSPHFHFFERVNQGIPSDPKPRSQTSQRSPSHPSPSHHAQPSFRPSNIQTSVPPKQEGGNHLSSTSPVSFPAVVQLYAVPRQGTPRTTSPWAFHTPARRASGRWQGLIGPLRSHPLSIGSRCRMAAGVGDSGRYVGGSLGQGVRGGDAEGEAAGRDLVMVVVMCEVLCRVLEDCLDGMKGMVGRWRWGTSRQG